MPSKIPTPELISEAINGAVYDLSGVKTLVVGTVPTPISGKTPILHGTLIVRYALPLLQPASDAIIPGLFAAEKGGMLVGREAWDYIQNQFQMHPRADVVGLRLNGTQAQVFLRELDFGAPVRVFVYADMMATVPAVEIGALYVGDAVPPLPDLLQKYLPTQSLEALLREPGN